MVPRACVRACQHAIVDFCWAVCGHFKPGSRHEIERVVDSLVGYNLCISVHLRAAIMCIFWP